MNLITILSLACQQKSQAGEFGHHVRKKFHNLSLSSAADQAKLQRTTTTPH
jgi:hypothetical protein